MPNIKHEKECNVIRNISGSMTRIYDSQDLYEYKCFLFHTHRYTTIPHTDESAS